METDTVETLKRRVNEAECRQHAETLAQVCEAVGIGTKTLQSRERGKDTAKRRAVVVWVLCDKLGWSQAMAARAVGRTTRQIKSMLRNERVTSPSKGK